MKKLFCGMLIALLVLSLPFQALAADDAETIEDIKAAFADILRQIDALQVAAADLEEQINALGDAPLPSTGGETLTGSAPSFGGEITAEVVLDDNGHIAQLSIDASSETIGIGSRVGDETFTDQFIGKAGPFEYGEGVDALSGATISSDAALEAIHRAIDQAKPAPAFPSEIVDLGDRIFVNVNNAELVKNDLDEDCLLLTLTWSHGQDSKASFAWGVSAAAYQDGRPCKINAWAGEGWSYISNNLSIGKGTEVDVYKAFVLYDTTTPITVEIMRSGAKDGDPKITLDIDPAQLSTRF